MLTAKLVRLQVRLSAFMYLITPIILFERMMSKNNLEKHFLKKVWFLLLKKDYLHLCVFP